MILCNQISLKYKDEVALHPLDLSIDKNDFVCILGASGSGKTSLLSLISGLREPSSGAVVIDGEVIHQPRLKTSTILQDYGLLPWKTVYQNIVFSFAKHGISIEESRVDSIAEQLGIKQYYKRYPHQLSGGQKQRVAITRALCLQSDLYLMDEAFSALDSYTKESLQDLLIQVREQEAMTTLFVTHNIEEAVYLGKRIIIMKEGRIVHDFSNEHHSNRDCVEYYEMCQKVRRYLHD